MAGSGGPGGVTQSNNARSEAAARAHPTKLFHRRKRPRVSRSVVRPGKGEGNQRGDNLNVGFLSS